MKMRFFLCVLSVLVSYPGFAQSSLGELLDQGARKVSKQEWLAGLPKKYSGPTASGRANVNLTYGADGSLSGNIQSLQGSTSGLSGNWTIDDNGKICLKETFHAWNQTYEGCGYEFKLGEQVWATPSDSDRAARIQKVTFTK